jgi:iron complex outermembrane recepter protein
MRTYSASSAYRLSRRPLFLALAASLSLASPLYAQSKAPEPASTETQTLDEISVIGSRRVAPRSSDTDTVVPVDVLSLDDTIEKSPQFDLTSSLQTISPSFFSTRQTGADGADLIDSASLRGLGSDQTLVLVNGKRRHTTALVNLFGARNRGSTGTDLNTLPTLGIERVEVLRDGAAAQYGSDAIAGVMNIVLKKDEGCEAVLGYGQYSRGDGINYTGSGYCGFNVGDGNLAVTAEYADRGRSDRSPGKRIIGDTESKNKTVYLNGELPVTEKGMLYLTAGIQQRDASSGAYERGGIGTDDIPSRNSARLYPDGFVPFINGDLNDRYLIAGFKTQFGEWYSDFSQTYGYNDLDYNISNTLNASIANSNNGISPTAFDAGGFSFAQYTTNVDFSKYYDSYFQGLNIAFGAEYRTERYKIRAGERGSYIDADGAGGGNAGSQGFPGFQPSDVTNKSRNNYALYGDFEATLSDNLTGDAALRFEDFSDFGKTINGKLAGAYKLNDTLTARSAISTGFRAPSLQQRFFSSTFTDFINGRPVDVLLAPNGGAIANAAGIPALKEEKSLNLSLGLTARLADDASLTLDLYRININDRIVLSGRFDGTDPTIGATLTRLGVGQAQFFANAVDTRTDGLDLTWNKRIELESGIVDLSAAYNHTKTNVRKVNLPSRFQGRDDLADTFLSERERLFIENGAPSSKGVFGVDYTRGSWNYDVKVIYFGQQVLGTFSGTAAGVPNAEYDPRVSADIALTYSITDNMKFSFGGANVFDQFPSKQDDLETDNGFIYDSVQFGLNGTSYFARLSAKF